MCFTQAVEGMLLVEREEKFADSHDYTALLLAMRVRLPLLHSWRRRKRLRRRLSPTPCVHVVPIS